LHLTIGVQGQLLASGHAGRTFCKSPEGVNYLGFLMPIILGKEQ
jgi:ABC-type uncharacterized transport system permease subunit